MIMINLLIDVIVCLCLCVCDRMGMPMVTQGGGGGYGPPPGSYATGPMRNNFGGPLQDMDGSGGGGGGNGGNGGGNYVNQQQPHGMDPNSMPPPMMKNMNMFTNA